MSAPVNQLVSAVPDGAALTHLPQLLPLLRELNDLKRVRVAGAENSLAEQLFARSWQALVAGEDPAAVALRETAQALVAVRLPGYTVPLFTGLGLSEEETQAVLQQALASAGAPLAPELLAALQAALASEASPDSTAAALRPAAPAFVAQLVAQPRAGATHPGRPRIMLVPTESHADHCALVAVYAVLLSPGFRAEPGEAFLTALTHHLHNATLPDPGFAGDELLGRHLPGLMQQATSLALAPLPAAVRRAAEAALLRTHTLDEPAAQAFHAADVFDRTLEMAWHDQSARFRLHQALDDLDIVHAGFTQTFHQQVLRAAGLTRSLTRATNLNLAVLLNPATTKIKWGIVGCGWVARDYVAPAIQASSNGQLVALCDLEERALAEFMPDDSQLRRTTSLADFAQTPGLEAVYVATPNASHAGVVATLAAAGLPVLCEKPLARTAAEAAEMLAAAEAHNTLLATAFDQRFHPAHQRLRELIEGGALGRITCLRLHYACWTPADWTPATDQGTYRNWRIDAHEAGGGAMIDLAPHGLDLAQVLLGEALTEIAALTQQRIHEYPVDDGAVLIARTASGVLVSHTVAYNCPDAYPRRTLEVIGDKGRALALNTMGQTPGGSLTLTRPDGSTEEVLFDQAASPFQRQVEAFAEAVQTNSPFPFPPTLDLHTMHLLDAAARPVAHYLTPAAGLYVPAAIAVEQP